MLRTLVPLLLLSAVPGVARADGEDPPDRVTSESVRQGTLRSRLVRDDSADLVLLYGGEQEGELGTCGCEVNPRGSFARVDRYARAVERHGEAPVLLLNPGGSLSAVHGEGTDLRADVVVRDRFVLDAMSEADYSAINVGYRDLPYLARQGMPSNAVSANVQPPPGGAGPATHIVYDLAGMRVAVTGVSTEGLRHMQVDGWTFADPVQALATLVPTIDADVVVVMAYEAGQLAPRLARVDGVDVLVEVGGFKGMYEPLVEGDAVWVRGRHRTEQLGELRLELDGGRVTAAHERKVDMDGMIPGTPALRRLERRAAREVRRELQALYGDLL